MRGNMVHQADLIQTLLPFNYIFPWLSPTYCDIKICFSRDPSTAKSPSLIQGESLTPQKETLCNPSTR